MRSIIKQPKINLGMVLSIFGIMLVGFQAAPPSEVLPPEKLSHIWVDLILSQELVDYYSDDDEVAQTLLTKNRLQVYALYDTDAATVEKSWQYYLLNKPKTALGIYNQVIEQLEALQP